MTIFHFAQLPVNETFGAGLSLERKARRPRPDKIDLAWKAGWTACGEEGPEVSPPAHFTDGEAAAFRIGRDDRFLSEQSDILDRLEDEQLDPTAYHFERRDAFMGHA
jgi:hypothetical protein